MTDILKSGGILYGVVMVLLESIIPVLPLGMFITFNINAYGFIIGVLISWMGTCLGCYLSYKLFGCISRKFLYNFINKKKYHKLINKIKTISFSNLVVLIALPFTPAFLINIACGIVEMNQKKFIVSIILGKIFIILFWGFVGKSLLESITDISTIIIISLFILVAYFLSKLVSKKLEIE